MSFNIGLSALSAASEEINVTGNNIANASTTGFKKSRTEFGDVFAASVLGGGAGNQQGSGVALQNIAQDFSQGNISFTGNALDLAINGAGFFVLQGDAGIVYTRAGAFGTDRDGNIVNSQGERLQGFAPTANGDASGGGPLTDLQVETGEIAPNATSLVNSIINLDASAAPSSVVGTTLTTNGGTSGAPQQGVLNSRTAEIVGRISTSGTDFSGTTAASITGNFNISGGLNFASAGGNQGFSISVNGGAFQAIDLSGADTANEAALITHVQNQLDLALSPPNNVIVSAQNNRLVLSTAATGDSSNITIGLVEGLANNIVTAGTSEDGKTAPSTGFTLTLDGDSRDIVIDEDFTNTSPRALALGGGAGSGNEALEDAIQAQIDSSPALTGRVTVAIASDGTIRFNATQPGEHNLQLDPINNTVGSVNFDQIVSFETDRRAGTIDISDLDFSGANDTSFTITVGTVSHSIVLNSDFNVGGTAAGLLGDHPESGLEALEDEIQRQINTSSLPGDVKVSIGADGDIAFELTDPNETDLRVASDSTTAQAMGDINVSNGFNFDSGIGGTEYTITVNYSVGGGPVVTSNAITLNTNYSTSAELVAGIQDAINTDANFAFSPGNEEVVVRIDPNSGFLILETADAGPLSQIGVAVTAPAPVPSPSVFQDTTALPGSVQVGSGPSVDFNSFVTFVGSEVDNTGTEVLQNGYESEVIRITDAASNEQYVEIPAGANANTVAQLFGNVSGVTAEASTTAYIVATNRGDPDNIGTQLNSDVDSNLPLRFTVNGLTFETSETDHPSRVANLALQINSSNSSLSARVTQDQNGFDILEITESNGFDLSFSGGGEGVGSITVRGATRDSATGEPTVSTAAAASSQISNLANQNQEGIVVGGIVNFTLDEGVTF